MAFFLFLGPDFGWGMLHVSSSFFSIFGFQGFWALYKAGGIVISEPFLEACVVV